MWKALVVSLPPSRAFQMRALPDSIGNEVFGARGELFYPPQVPNDSLVTTENAKNSMWQYMINIWVGCL